MQTAQVRTTLLMALLLAVASVKGAAPANDNFAERATLSGFPVTVEANNAEATREPGEPLHASSFQSHSLWWTWTAPFTGRIGVLVTKFLPEAIAIYRGDALDNLVEVARQLPAGLLPWEVQQGVTYQIAVDGSNDGTEGAFRLELLALPANDMFRDRITVPPAGAWLSGTTALSTHEEGEPDYARYGWAGSVWYTWTPDISGPVWMTTVGSSFPADIYIFKGNSINELQGVPRSALFDAEAGVTYQLAITGFRAAGEFRLGILRTAPNDHFANRIPVEGLSFVLEGWTLLATAESGEPDAGPSPDSLHSVWWTWTAPASGRVLIQDRPGNIAGIAIYTGTNASKLVQVPTSGGAFDVVAGRTYQIRASNPEGGGLVNIAWTLYPVAANDAFARRIALTGTSLVVTSWNFQATREAGEPRHADFNVGRPPDERYGAMRQGSSLWWTWTAPADGWVHIDPTGSDFDPVIAVYTGEKLRRLKPVTLNQDLVYGNVGGVAEFQAEAGQTYQIVLDGPPQGPHQRPEPARGRLLFSVDLTTLALVQPAQGRVYVGPTNLTLQVGQPDVAVDGHLEAVQFYTQTYNNAAVPLVASGPSLSAIVTNMLPGYYWLYARGTNEQGKARVSRPTIIAIRPSNDQFSSSQPVAGYSVTNNGYIGAATWEPGEKKIAGGRPGSGSVWWSWTAPGSGTAKLVVYGETVSVWTGASLRGLKRVGYSTGNELTFRATRGVRYYISTAAFRQTLFNTQGPGTALRLELNTVELTMPSDGLSLPEPASIPLAIRTTEPSNAIARVDYYSGNELVASSTQAPFSTVWSNAPAWTHQIRAVLVKTTGEQLPTAVVTTFVRPTNDQFANAFALVGTNLQANGIGISASLEPGEPAANVQGTIWWRWTAPSDGRVIIRPNTNGFLRLNAYAGSQLSNLVSVADPTGTIQFEGYLTFHAQAGQTYSFAVEGSGRLGFQLDLVLAPDNDNFAQRRPVAGEGPILDVYNFAATSEPGEPVHSSQPGSRTVWFTWTAPRSGSVRFSNRGVGYDMAVAVYTGSVLSNLTRVAEIPTSSQTIWFNVVKDVAYAIAAGDRREGVWNVPIDLTYEAPPLNDPFAQAFEIVGPYLQGSILSATREPNEPAHGGVTEGNSVWWKWTAPSAGTIHSIVMTPYFKPRVAFYSGTTLSNLTEVATATNQLDASVTAGTPYRVAIDTADGRVGSFLFEFHFTPAPVPSPAMASSVDAVAAPAQGVSLQIRRGGATAKTGEAVHLRVQGEVGRWFVLQASEDLVAWKEVTQGILAEGGFEFIEPDSTTAPQRFYRALVGAPE